MPRWAPDSFERLQAAAFDLFEEQGFERTTVAEIVARAGLTSRTFFNHFADKREVLFGLSGPFEQQVSAHVAEADPALTPLETVVNALALAAGMFEQHQDAVRRRHRILQANAELLERDRSKIGALTEVVAAALQARGQDQDEARMTAGAGVLVWQTAERAWAGSSDPRPLGQLLTDALQALRTAVADPGPHVRRQTPHP